MRSKKASLFHGIILAVVEFSQIIFEVKLVNLNSQLYRVSHSDMI